MTSDRFLKLLVAQMQNQDPLNPMDNAQVTSQMAQINTVTGIEKLNTTVQGLNGQFVQLQALQGASLVGRDVIVAGNRCSVDRRAASARAASSSPRRRRGQGRDPERRAARDRHRSNLGAQSERPPQLRLAGRQRRPTPRGLHVSRQRDHRRHHHGGARR